MTSSCCTTFKTKTPSRDRFRRQPFYIFEEVTWTYSAVLGSIVDIFEVFIKHQLLAVAGATKVAAPHVRVVESNVFVHA